MLNFTPSDRLSDSQGRPYFLWDCDLTLRQFLEGLESADPEARAYLIGKLMRQAKPDDVFLFVQPRAIRELWPRLSRYLGRTHAFWTWLFDTWEGQGRDVQVLRTTPAFGQLRAADENDTCVVDLVAEPFEPIEPPLRVEIEGASIAVDTRHEILASKLATLLERSEVRDVIDVKALLEAGEDFADALRDAPRKDAGFSVLTLAWVVRGFELRAAADALGLDDGETKELLEFRDKLVDRLTSAATPE